MTNTTKPYCLAGAHDLAEVLVDAVQADTFHVANLVKVGQQQCTKCPYKNVSTVTVKNLTKIPLSKVTLPPSALASMLEGKFIFYNPKTMYLENLNGDHVEPEESQEATKAACH